MRPPVGTSWRSSRRRRVDFPAPLGPVRNTNSPLSMRSDSSRMAYTPRLYILDTFCASIIFYAGGFAPPHPPTRSLVGPLCPTPLAWLTGCTRSLLLLPGGIAKHAAEARVDARGIRLSRRRLHDLSDDEAERLRLAGAVVGDRSGVLLENLGDDAIDGVLIVDRREPLGRHDLRGAAARAVHQFEDFLRDRAGDGPFVD